jgi:hypothetical protein
VACLHSFDIFYHVQAFRASHPARFVKKFRLRYVEKLMRSTGITGGFAPPIPSAIHELQLESGAQSIALSSKIREDGTPDLQPPVQKSIPPESHDTSELLSELESILKKLPTEEMPSCDIYGRDIGIRYMSEDFSWFNAAPQGCSQSESSVKVSDEEKKSFNRAVDIVETLVQRGVAHEG